MPEWSEEIRRRLRSARLTGAAEAEIVEELTQHLDDRYAELRARGESEEEARRIALDELEEETALGDRVRAAARVKPDPVALGVEPARGALLGSVLADLRIGARMLRRTPGFTLIAAVVIALGIGANTALFSVLNTLLLRPPEGVRAPSELVAVYTSDYSGPRYGANSVPDALAMRESGAFAGVAVHRPQTFSVLIGEQAAQTLGEIVSADYFSVLGVRPAAGRLFIADEAGGSGTSTSVLIGHAFWQERLGGAPDVIGRSIRINGHAMTIVGVVEPSFNGLLRGVRADVWIPLSAPTALAGNVGERGSRGYFVMARQRPGVDRAAAQQRMNVVAAGLHAEFTDYWTDVNEQSRVITVLDESDARIPPQLRGQVFGMIALLMSVVGVVLLIACSNVANLMLTRAASRRAEMGVRMALGATRGRVVRQLLAESMLLALLGGAAGVLLAFWIMRMLTTQMLPVRLPFVFDIALDFRVLAFATAITLVTGILFGLMPALHGSRAPAPLMKDSARAGARMRTRNVLVVVQVAASVVLLAGGALFMRSLMTAQNIDIGIEADNIAVVPLSLELEGYSEEQAQRFYTDLREQVAALPGVTGVTMAERVPLSGWARRSIVVDGYTPAQGEDMEIGFNGVTDGYFEAIGIRVLAGRTFTPADNAAAPTVAIVNEAFARRFFGGANPVGRRVGTQGAEGPMAEIVGLVPDAKYRSLTEEPTPYLYYAYAQQPRSSMMLHVSTALDPHVLAPALRERVRELAPNMAPPAIVTLRSRVDEATLVQRIAVYALGVLGILALGIAAIGLYGVISYVVVQRTHEFGVRTALGADSRAVLRMVIGQGVRLALVGVVIGTVLALGLAQLLRSLLFVSPADPVALLAAAGVLTLTAVFASWLPARRATRVDPLTALRSE
jgi:predicted permease